MANHLIDVRPSSTSAKSGDAINLDIDYESDNGGAILISSGGGGFTVTPHSVDVPGATAATKTVPVTISRDSAKTDNCLLVVSFYMTSRNILVAVT